MLRRIVMPGVVAACMTMGPLYAVSSAATVLRAGVRTASGADESGLSIAGYVESGHIQSAQALILLPRLSCSKIGAEVYELVQLKSGSKFYVSMLWSQCGRGNQVHYKAAAGCGAGRALTATVFRGRLTAGQNVLLRVEDSRGVARLEVKQGSRNMEIPCGAKAATQVSIGASQQQPGPTPVQPGARFGTLLFNQVQVNGRGLQSKMAHRETKRAGKTTVLRASPLSNSGSRFNIKQISFAANRLDKR